MEHIYNSNQSIRNKNKHLSSNAIILFYVTVIKIHISKNKLISDTCTIPKGNYY